MNSKPRTFTAVNEYGEKQTYDVLIGDRVWFEYHCNESHDSADAKIWYHSHQQCVVLSLEDAGGGATFAKRGYLGHPAVFKVRFDDGFEWDAFEDELTYDKSDFCRPDPPAPRVENDTARALIQRLIHAEPLVEARGPTMKSIKKGKVKLSDAEHKKVMAAGAVWHSASSGKKPVAAIWKSVVRGKTWYGCNTHRAYACKPTLRGAIAAFKFIKTTA